MQRAIRFPSQPTCERGVGLSKVDSRTARKKRCYSFISHPYLKVNGKRPGSSYERRSICGEVEGLCGKVEGLCGKVEGLCGFENAASQCFQASSPQNRREMPNFSEMSACHVQEGIHRSRTGRNGHKGVYRHSTAFALLRVPVVRRSVSAHLEIPSHARMLAHGEERTIKPLAA